MNDKPPYRKWVGVVLGFLLNGSAHFLSGKRATGVKWYFSIVVCGYLSLVIMAIPGIAAYVIGILLCIIALLLWFIMLKQSYRPVPRIRFLGWVGIIMINFGLSSAWTYAVRSVVHPFRVPNGTMSPTIMPGDHLFAEKLSFMLGDPERGDIVVFRTDGIPSFPSNEFYIKRVAGVPGDTVRIDPPKLIVNGKILSDPMIFRRIASAQAPFTGFQLGGLLVKPTDEIVLKKDQYLVLGDNPRNSRDSRYWGPVPRKNIVGKATRIYWPLNRVSQSFGKE